MHDDPLKFAFQYSFHFHSTIERLREISRQHYLEKREKKELQLLDYSLKDEQYLFDDVGLTKEEMERRELNQKILSMASDKYRFDYKDNGTSLAVYTIFLAAMLYHLPDPMLS